VTKLDAIGSALVYSTYLGGSDTTDYGAAIAVDGLGHAYVTGITSAGAFPTVNPLQSALAGYQVNKVDFLNLLDSRMTLFNYERELYDSLADYQMKRAQLEALVGKELP
jgi:hypothetical protein